MFSEIGLHSQLNSELLWRKFKLFWFMVTVSSVCSGLKTGVMSVDEIFGFMGKKIGQNSCKEFLVSLEKTEGERKKVQRPLCDAVSPETTVLLP